MMSEDLLLNSVFFVSLCVLIVGGLNWGVTGARMLLDSSIESPADLFGIAGMRTVGTYVYVAVGLAAIVVILMLVPTVGGKK